MNSKALFRILDINRRGELCRSDLREAARRLQWYWREAPLFAVLDLLTLNGPIPERRFVAFMSQIAEDPHGPYGKVLLHSPHFITPAVPGKVSTRSPEKEFCGATGPKAVVERFTDATSDEFMSMLKAAAGPDAGDRFRNLSENYGLCDMQVASSDAALLIVDPQRSFTRGAWMKSIGPGAETDVEPIRFAFERCAQFLSDEYGRVEVMFTRCPFPPDSYQWDEALADIIDDNQRYFIKPGNSVLFPPTNGFREWVDRFLRDGKQTLVMAGCTLNSCLRVSATDASRYFGSSRLRVVVDLSMAGARATSYRPSPLYGGESAVEAAVAEMTDSGVRVARRVHWI